MNDENQQLWEKINSMGEILAVLRAEVFAIHKRLDEWGGHIQTRETCEIISRNNLLRMDDHEERLKVLEKRQSDTPQRVLWIMFSAIAGAFVSLLASGKL